MRSDRDLRPDLEIDGLAPLMSAPFFTFKTVLSPSVVSLEGLPVGSHGLSRAGFPGNIRSGILRVADSKRQGSLAAIWHRFAVSVIGAGCNWLLTGYYLLAVMLASKSSVEGRHLPAFDLYFVHPGSSAEIVF